MRIFFVIFLLLFSRNAWAQHPDPGIRTWEAQWITNPDTSRKNNLWSVFQTALFIPANADLSNTWAYISADSKYWLYINDRLAVFDGNLKRGPNRTDGYYDAVRLDSFLQPGENQIRILHWFWGRNGFSHKNSGKPGLVFELQNAGFSLLSSSSWLVATHPAYYTTQSQNPNYRLPEYNVAFDARRTQWHWVNAEQAGKPPVSPWGRLWKRPIPLWLDAGLKAYDSLQIVQTDSAVIAIGKLPKNLSINPRFDIETQTEGFKIDIRTDNYIGGSEPNLRTEYLTRKGSQQFESPGYFNGHEVRYLLPKDVQIKSLQYRETRFNTRYTGRFETDDVRLNSLVEKSLNTLNVNMRDGIQDPDRERAQWWGDVVIIMGEVFYALDESGYSAVKKAISNLVEWQKEDGVLFSPVPAGSWDKELPAQMLASIGQYGFWKYFVYTRDTAMIRYVYPHVRKYLDLWQIDPAGQVAHRPGGWSWYDWGDGIDVELLDHLWMYQALQAYAKMSSLLGNEMESEKTDKQVQLIGKRIVDKYWNGRYYASGKYPEGQLDDRANGLAALMDFTDRNKWLQLRDRLFETRKAGPYMEKFVVDAFFAHGDGEMGFKRMMERYAEMIDSPVSTLWEGWKVGSGVYGGGSYNHGWSGWPVSTSGEYIAGLTPCENQASRLFWRPHLSVLKEADYYFQLLRNDIHVSYRKQGRGARYQLTRAIPGPVNITLDPGELKEYRKIMLNGRKLRKSNPTGTPKAGRYAVNEAGAIVFDFSGETCVIELK